MLMVEINKNVLKFEIRFKVFYCSVVEEYIVFFMMDMCGCIIYVNLNFCDMMDCLVEDFIGM